MTVVADLRVRPAVPADYSAFIRLREELGVPDAAPDPDDWERDRMRDTRCFDAGGRLVAYAYFEIFEALGYVRNVVVDPAFRQRGIGREVMRELARQLRAAGCRELCLNVKRSNDAAIRLYESVGMRRAYQSASLRFDWRRIDEIRDEAQTPSADRMSILSVLAEHDTWVERRFGLPSGLLAARRRRDGTLLFAVCEPQAPGALAAFASFDLEFGGAFPLCAANAAAARTLLTRMRVAAPESESVLVVIENDPRLEQQLLAAGAESVLQVWHYRASLSEEVSET